MEVAAAVGTELALSGLSLVINKLASNFGGDVTADEIEHLNVFVAYEIEALIREAKSDDLVKSAPLLEKLQAAALELEELLDLYEYNQIKKQVRSSSSSSNPIKKLVPKFKEKLGPILSKSSLRIGVEKLLKFIQQVEKKHPFITSRTSVTKPQANTVTPTTSTLLSPYFGRENQYDSIIEFLLDESHADSCRGTYKVPAIAIIGMGGSGKSHTAQRICSDDRIKNHFDANMWVHVTRDFDVVGLTKKMVESANNDECPQITNLDVLQKKLIESLSNQKKILLVLDDVWCEDKMKWDLLVGPLNEVARNGSKIIITTRIENIAHNSNAKKIYLEDLKAEECWSVLKHYAFGNYEETIDDQELINVGNQIISKVKHSPLALRVVGSSLSNKRSVNEWEKILKQDMLKETMDLLLFSYQCLPLHLQRCFAYCSLFPKGYRFYFDVDAWEPHLIPLWIAQGFIENTSELTLEQAGMKYIEELLSYSFFEKKSDRVGDDYLVIHDLLHDLAENVSKKQCHRIEHHGDSLHIPTTCIHLSLFTEEKLSSIHISNIFKLTSLRTLIISRVNGSEDIFENKKYMSENLSKLRAFYVRPYQKMEVFSDIHIDKLKHLRYLTVQYDSKVPMFLTKLYQLQFLILTNVSVDGGQNLLANTLPHGFGNLINLRTLQFRSRIGLRVDYLNYDSKLINIEKLTSLQNLEKFPVNGSNRMISLRNLPLCGSLSILNLENVRCKDEAEKAMLKQKKNLNELIFEWDITQSSINTCEGVLEGLEPHRNLEKLKISCYQGVRFPNWMVKENWLPRLESLSLQDCTSLKIVQFLPPRLQQLYVCGCNELMQLPPLSDTLRTIHLCGCSKLTPPLMFNKSSGLCDLSYLTNLESLHLSEFPNLQALTDLSPTVSKLSIGDCPKLTSLGNLQRCTYFESLEIWKCPMLIGEETLMEGVVEEGIANRLPHVVHVDIDEPLLVHELVQRQALSSIQTLTLRDCATLPKLEKLSSLKSLTIKCSPVLKSLPNLPVSLTEINIFGCPKLMEKYKVGGPLRNTISHLSYICMD